MCGSIRRGISSGFIVLLALCASAFAAAVGGQVARGSAADPNKPSDIRVSRITDPQAKAAVQQIFKKQAEIKEVVVEDLESRVWEKRGTITHNKGQFSWRGPNMLFVKYSDLHGKTPGTIHGMALDGATAWELMIPSKRALESIAENMKQANKPEAEIDDTLKKKKMSIVKVDLEALRQKGIYDKYVYPLEAFRRLFNPVDPATLKLAGETDAEWVLTAKSRKDRRSSDYGKDTIRMTVKKDSGLCVRYEYTSNNENGYCSLVTIDKITINPVTPIADSVFKFEPPAGADVKDETENKIRFNSDSELLMYEGWMSMRSPL